jgi:hypothetical protein
MLGAVEDDISEKLAPAASNRLSAASFQGCLLNRPRQSAVSSLL